MTLGNSLRELFLVLLVIVKFAGIIACCYGIAQAFEHVNDTYHDTHVICLQVAHNPHSCK